MKGMSRYKTVSILKALSQKGVADFVRLSKRPLNLFIMSFIQVIFLL